MEGSQKCIIPLIGLPVLPLRSAAYSSLKEQARPSERRASEERAGPGAGAKVFGSLLRWRIRVILTINIISNIHICIDTVDGIARWPVA